MTGGSPASISIGGWTGGGTPETNHCCMCRMAARSTGAWDSTFGSDGGVTPRASGPNAYAKPSRSNQRNISSAAAGPPPWAVPATSRNSEAVGVRLSHRGTHERLGLAVDDEDGNGDVVAYLDRKRRQDALRHAVGIDICRVGYGASAEVDEQQESVEHALERLHAVDIRAQTQGRHANPRETVGEDVAR